MATFKEYTKKNGKKAWMVTAYIGFQDGKQKNITRRGFKSEREARLALSRIEAGVDKPKEKDEKPKIYTYQAVYDLWIEEYSRTVKASTLLKTEQIFKNHILPALGTKVMKEIKPLEVQEIMFAWHNKLARASMVMNYAGMVFDYAIRMELISSNPTKVIKKPVRVKAVKRDEDLNFYDKKELKKFMKALENGNNFRAYVYFRLLAFTGIRKGESLALEWSDIDLDNQILNINKAVSRTATGLHIQTPKTPASVRRISLDDKTVEILKEYHKMYNEHDLLFCTVDGSILSPAKPRKWYMAALKNLPKNFKYISIHGFRHTHASLLFEAGASIKDVQSRLGHSDIQTTMNIYTHVTKDAKEKLANKFNTYIDF